ncbi:MAG: BrnT family toxin, partial [Methylococcales bacterium]
KNPENLRKHGVSLADGDGVLSDPLALTVEDQFSKGEQRFVSMGMNTLGQLRIVVYTYRDKGVRLISVRKPEPSEIRAYEERI